MRIISFVKTLIGNKYGNTPIPLEISESDYLKIRVATSTTGNFSKLKFKIFKFFLKILSFFNHGML